MSFGWLGLAFKVPWRLGMPLQSPLEAGSAFSELLEGQGNITMSDAMQKSKTRCSICMLANRLTKNIRNLGEQPLTVLPHLWG